MTSGTTSTGRGGPLRAVLAALDAGAADPGEVASRTGLDRGVVAAAVAHLIRTGHLRTEQLASGCPQGGCGTCGSHTGDGVPGLTAAGGCRGTAGPADGRGPVLITLSRRPRG
jgi:hypothetical protein